MKSPLKCTNGPEKIGLSLIVLSLVFLLFHKQLDGTGVARLMQEHELFFWMGLLIWAVGYMMREQAGKTKTSELKNDETKD